MIAARKIAEGTNLILEIQPRFSENSSNLGQILVRPSVSFTLFDQTILSLGYAYVRTSPTDGAITNEHRPWQQLAFPIVSREGVFTISNRTRFEQRYREDGDEIGLRLRQQLRLMVPVSETGWQAVAWTEGFFNFNDTDCGAQAGLDRWRNFVGFNIPLNGGATLEPGYLNQYVNLVPTDRTDHVLSVTLTMNF